MARRPLEYNLEVLRQQIVEATIREAYETYGPEIGPPVPRRTGTVLHRSGFSHDSPGAWYPVTKAEVEVARQRAFRCGVTLSTWMHWHLLRRNYEADPNVRQKGEWKKVKRGPPATISYGLMMILKKPGLSMLSLADQIDDLGCPPTEDQQYIRKEIGQIFADMCRPLAPRRSGRQTLTH